MADATSIRAIGIRNPMRADGLSIVYRDDQGLFLIANMIDKLQSIRLDSAAQMTLTPYVTIRILLKEVSKL